MTLDKLLFDSVKGYPKDQYLILKVGNVCPYYLSSTTSEGLMANPLNCGACDGQDENCNIYNNYKRDLKE